MISELETLFRRHGKPAVLRSDNGREFIAATLAGWLAGQAVQTAFIEKGSPQQNPFERFNATMRDELLKRRRVRQPARSARHDRRLGSTATTGSGRTAGSA